MKLIAFACVYLAGTLLTLGYGYNRCSVPHLDAMQESCGAVSMAPIWPLYWAGHLAIEVTK